MKLPRYCSASNMFVQTNVPSFDAILRKSKYSTLKRVIESDNSIVRILYDTDVFYKSKLFCNIYYVK